MEGQSVAIITGAASGIGEDTSYAFVKLDFSLVLVDMNADNLSKVADKIRNKWVSSDKVLTIREDISEQSSFDSIINQTITRFGRIDLLVNNAGFFKCKTFEDLTVDSMDKTYQVMLRAPLFLSQKAFPHLRKTKGCIINVSSMVTKCVFLNAIDYCSVKAGLEHLTRCLALEGAKHGVRVNSIHPGPVKTSSLKGTPNEEKFLEEAKSNIPLGRLGTVTDIASAITYLATEGASYITGASLFVDGGSVLATPWSGITTE